jgi:hypothetical protein
MTEVRRTLYFRRYPWLIPERHDEMRALVKKVGRALAEALLREECAKVRILIK